MTPKKKKKKSPSLKSIPRKSVSDDTAGQLRGGMMRRDDSTTGTSDATDKSSEVDEG
ncbi:MAG: hypothetical protein ACHQQ3_04930 [Gemmatimonadales bacterium]